MLSLTSFFADVVFSDGLSTQDTVNAIVPLLEQLADTHDDQLVGPSDHWEKLFVERGRIWFELKESAPPQRNFAEVNRRQVIFEGAVAIVAETVRVVDEKDSYRELHLLQPADTDFKQPGYVMDYQSWEQLLGHHDASVDAYLCGLLLAGIALGLDLRLPGHIERFVSARQNLFAIRSDLHPVIARAIVQLTELDRTRRPTDMRAVAQSLTNYRGESVELEYELAAIEGFQTSDPRGKQDTILTRLQQRLFDLSRRNRLLHFRSSSSSANLTIGSVPLTQDWQSIDADHILTWNQDLQDRLISGKPILLNEHLNFVEACYLPSVMERIRGNARRDAAEYGFAQLRLVACFLRWSNLKEDPPQRYESPLVLLPVTLRREKGVQDQYYLESPTSVAEVNPAVRYHLNSLYGIELPESIDLSETDLGELYRWLTAQLDQSGQGLQVQYLDRPRVEVVYHRARRRLEQHLRRAKSRRRGYRTYGEFDYSYDASTYDPLGVKLFLGRVHSDREVFEGPIFDRDGAMVELPNPERPGGRVRLNGPTLNHHVWEFDLCSVTLANFRYRRMSLVRDYEAILDQGLRSPAFDATFSLDPKPIDREAFRPPDLSDRQDILPADSSQAAAIGAARAGSSYIIQGPPGTGKSQTIANLIADYVARGKRVLFVCEKRAALDVVYVRLCTQGLQDVCTLIHDALSDKKSFVMELQRTYNRYLEDRRRDESSSRRNALDSLQHQLDPLIRFGDLMVSSDHRSAMPTVQMFERLLELGVKRREEIDESLPDVSHWHHHKADLQRLIDVLASLSNASSVFSRHPLANISPELLGKPRPRQWISEQTARSLEILTSLERLSEQCELPSQALGSMQNLAAVRAYVLKCNTLASTDNLALSDPLSERSQELERLRDEVLEKQQQLQALRDQNCHWKERLDRQSATIAKQQLQRLELSWMRWLQPTWWRLRGTLNRRYRIDKHPVRPLWSQVIDQLLLEYVAADAIDEAESRMLQRLGISGDLDWLDAEVSAVRAAIKEIPQWLGEFHRGLLERMETGSHFSLLIEFTSLFDRWSTICDGFLLDIDPMSVSDLIARLRNIEPALVGLADFMDCLKPLSLLSTELQSAIRVFPDSLGKLEGRLLENSLLRLELDEREFARFSGEQRDTLASRGYERYQQLLLANASTARGRVRDRFLERVALTNGSASGLSEQEKNLREQYRKGRRVLEHEFGKSMRYRAIRDLAAAESGVVVRDLKPVWLMSPLSVADTLPLDCDLFDVVIFDEASQVTLESAAPTLFRAPQVIIVGDEMQLPPTSFFESHRDSAEDELSFQEDGEVHEYSLSADSLLNHASRNLASTMLSWHYRSRNELLISFSNWRFYHGRLLTVPEEELLLSDAKSLDVQETGDAVAYATLALSRAVSFHQLLNGVYERRRNRSEAEYIASLTREILSQPENMTLGIIAFSEAQQDEIENALQKLADEDDSFRQRLDAELEREEGGQFVGLLVKNLENIQGDERDIIILSVCYGPGPDGRMLMNFGPINRAGGEKRLNVAFTRAKHHMMLISSIDHSKITNEHNDGAYCLKCYLRYAAAVSVGDNDELELVLRGLSLGRETADGHSKEAVSHAARQIAQRFEDEGFCCDFAVGHSGFRCDLAIYRQGDQCYRLGVLLDAAQSYQLNDPIEREILRPRLLEIFGWNVERVLVKDWWNRPETVIKQLRVRLE
jgi:hypothetical protein